MCLSTDLGYRYLLCVTSSPFHPSLIFLAITKSLRFKWSTVRGSTWVSSCLALKYWTWEQSENNQYSIDSSQRLNNGEKSFITFVPARALLRWRQR